MGSPILPVQAGWAEGLPKGRAVELLLCNTPDGNSSCSCRVCCVAVRITSSPASAASLMRAEAAIEWDRTKYFV